MSKHKFPPKGYDQMEYPLPHNFNYQFGLSPETATKNTTYVPLIKCMQDINPPDTIEVNPSHADFNEETGCIVQSDSIVPKLNIHMQAQMSQPMIEEAPGDGIRYIKFNWMPIYLAFKDMYEAIDNKEDVEVEDILEMTHTVVKKVGKPLYNNVKLLVEDDWPVSTINHTEVFGDVGMDTDLKGEGVTFDEELMWDALSYYSNSSMLAKAMGQWHTQILRADFPWIFNSNNFTNPSVKRGNEYTFCGILFHVPLVATPEQFYTAADLTEATSVVNFDIKVRYDEWNSQFDQTAY